MGFKLRFGLMQCKIGLSDVLIDLILHDKSAPPLKNAPNSVLMFQSSTKHFVLNKNSSQHVHLNDSNICYPKSNTSLERHLPGTVVYVPEMTGKDVQLEPVWSFVTKTLFKYK